MRHCMRLSERSFSSSWSWPHNTKAGRCRWPCPVPRRLVALSRPANRHRRRRAASRARHSRRARGGARSLSPHRSADLCRCPALGCTPHRRHPNPTSGNRSRPCLGSTGRDRSPRATARTRHLRGRSAPSRQAGGASRPSAGGDADQARSQREKRMTHFNTAYGAKPWRW